MTDSPTPAKLRDRTDVLWCANNGKGRSNGWSFPPRVRRILEADCAGKRVLQMFGGHSTFGTRLDVDPIVRPDVIGDAWLPPFKRESFDVVILDPPYFTMNAQVKTALFRAAGYIVVGKAEGKKLRVEVLLDCQHDLDKSPFVVVITASWWRGRPKALKE